MKRYNTPHRSRVVKTRMTEEEYAAFAERLSAYNMSQAEFIRQAITGAAIRCTVAASRTARNRVERLLRDEGACNAASIACANTSCGTSSSLNLRTERRASITC